MSRRSRAARVERSLPPGQAVLRWLADAQAFGSLGALADWLVDQPEAEHPMQVAADLARSGPRGDRPAALAAAREAALLLQIAFELNDRAREELALATEARLHVWWRLRGVAAERALAVVARGDVPAPEPDALARAAAVLVDHRTRLLVLDRACRDIDDRFFGGHRALWPDLAEDLARLLRDARRQLGALESLYPEGVPGAGAWEAAVAAGAAEAVRSVVGLARARVLWESGGERDAAARAGRLVRRARDRRRPAPEPAPG